MRTLTVTTKKVSHAVQFAYEGSPHGYMFVSGDVLHCVQVGGQTRLRFRELEIGNVSFSDDSSLTSGCIVGMTMRVDKDSSTHFV